MLPAAGTALLLLVIVDAVMTVLHPSAYAGPLTRGCNRLVWASFKVVARRLHGQRRRGWLSYAGPIMAALVPGVWVVLLITGFALIYHPWIGSFLVSTGSLRGPLLESFYVSGYSATTLGVGDVVADLPALRLLMVLEALSGFALLTAALGYILSIYSERGTMTAVALQVAAAVDAVGGRAEFERRMRALTDEEAKSWSQWLGGLAEPVSRVWQAHSHYPILHYFHNDDDRAALPVQAGALLSVRRIIEANQNPALAGAPGARITTTVIAWYVTSMDRLFVRSNTTAEVDEGSADEVEQAHRRLLRHGGYEEDDC